MNWEVDGVTLEGFFEQFKIDDCSLQLKIDIEGGEALVMPAAVALLKEQRPHVYLITLATVIAASPSIRSEPSTLHAPLMEEPSISRLHRRNHQITRHLPFSLFKPRQTHHSKFRNESFIARDTNLQRFSSFEIIATDLHPGRAWREACNSVVKLSKASHFATTRSQSLVPKIFHREA